MNTVLKTKKARKNNKNSYAAVNRKKIEYKTETKLGNKHSTSW